MTLKELNHNKAEIGTFEKNERLGDPGPALTFIFTMLTMEFWGINAGIFSGPTMISVGVVQIACFIPI